MTSLNITYYARCVTTLDKAFSALNLQAPDSVEYDIYRAAAKHSLIGLDEAERWMKYRDNRNDTAHDYGEDFANETLALMPAFLVDAAHDASDLDLVLRTPDPTPIPPAALLAFKDALGNSSIPIFIDVRDWARLPATFHSEILRNYVELEIKK